MMEIGVKKLYLEDFYYWTQRVGGFTAEVMGDILKSKADALAINLVLNSFSTMYNDVVFRREGVRPSRSCAICDTRSCRRSGFCTRREWSR